MRGLVLVVGLCCAHAASAGPMGFKDSWMGMGDFNPNWREGWMNYALTPRDAVRYSATASCSGW